MKNYSHQPTTENALEYFLNDSLGRNQSIFQFVRLLDSINDSCAIALNGNWGSGKTFFVKQVKLILDSSNSLYNMDDKTRKSVKFKFECHECYTSVYYDAWTNDHHDDPLLSLIYAVISTKQSDFKPAQSKSYLEIVASIADALSGRDISSVLKNFKGTDPLSPIKETEDIRSLIKEFLDALIEEHGNRLVIFIDELDRCKPDYAVRLLERIKHYFDDDRVTFVFSVCIQELQWTIKAYYGSEFSATRYLDKFFDLRVALPSVDRIKFMEMQTNFGRDIRFSVCAEIINRLEFSLREIERYIRLVKIASSCFEKDDPELQYCSVYIMPIIIALQMYDIAAYHRFIHGHDSETLVEILSNVPTKRLSEELLNFKEYYAGTVHSSLASVEVNFRDKIQIVYLALFSEHYTDSTPCVDIGNLRFSQSVRDKLSDVVNLISPNLNYDFE